MMLCSTVSVTCLSPPQSPLCVIWRLVGEKKESVWCYFYWNTHPAETSVRREVTCQNKH